jgi:SET domain-containing protein
LDSNVAGAGKGLFALSKQDPDNAILFRTGDIVIEYDGESVSHNQLDRRYGDYTAPYALAQGITIEDAACRRGIGSIANHAHRKRDSNVRFSLSRSTGRFRLIATKPIRNGHEILSHYGNDYRFDEPTSHTTRR